MRIGKIHIRKEEDILRVRRAVKGVTELMGFGQMDRIRVVTAASELTRNLYESASGGEIVFEVTGNGGAGLQMVFTDRDGGIEDLERVLDGSYQSPAGVGIGLRGARSLMDDFDIVSVPGEGTTVTMTKWLPHETTFSPTAVYQLREALAGVSEESALESLKAQNRELLGVLDELKSRNSDLEAINSELAVTNAGIVALYEELDRKNDDLDRASRNKSKFLRSLGHEIRTPISSIITITGLLSDHLDGELSPEQDKQVGMVAENARHLLGLVNDLLDLSRIEAGIIDLRPTELTVEELFAHASSTMAPLAAEKGLSLEFITSQDLPVLKTDLKRVLQVLLNLVGNAVKFTDRGGVTVTASRADASAGEGVEIAVRDTGIGIPADQQELIFAEFKQAHSRDDIGRGSGLGLTITMRLLERLGGEISVESEPGHGSTFRFSLPIEPGKAREAPFRRRAQARPHGKTVLVVEDDEKMVYSLRTRLEAEGFDVLVARTREKAMNLAAQHSVFAIFLDIRPPREEDGWMLLEHFKRSPELSATPVLVVTASRCEERARELEADEYFTQPVDTEELIAALAKYLEKRTLETILVVDDEEAERVALQKYLGSEYRVITAANGREALAAMEREDPDLIILDLIMPVMNGFEFLDTLRRERQNNDIPVVVFSAKDLSPEEELHLGQFVTRIMRKGETDAREVARSLKSVHAILTGEES